MKPRFFLQLTALGAICSIAPLALAQESAPSEPPHGPPAGGPAAQPGPHGDQPPPGGPQPGQQHIRRENQPPPDSGRTPGFGRGRRGGPDGPGGPGGGISRPERGRGGAPADRGRESRPGGLQFDPNRGHPGTPPGSGGEGAGPFPPPQQVQMKPSPYIGVVTTQPPPPLRDQVGLPDGFGLLVLDLVPDGPAAKAGIQRHDILKRINDQHLINPEQLAALVRHFGKDTEVTLTIIRKGAEQTVTLKIGEHLAPVPTAALGINPFEGQPTSPSVNSAYFLRRMNPGAEIRIENQSGVNTWRPGRGRLALNDDQGLLVIDIRDGHRVLSARNPKGEVIFEGPIDNDEQRNAVPEPIRARLKILEAQQREAPSPARPPSGPRPQHPQPGVGHPSPGHGPAGVHAL